MSVEVFNPEGLSKPDMYRQVAVASGSRLDRSGRLRCAGRAAREPLRAPMRLHAASPALRAGLLLRAAARSRGARGSLLDLRVG